MDQEALSPHWPALFFERSSRPYAQHDGFSTSDGANQITPQSVRQSEMDRSGPSADAAKIMRTRWAVEPGLVTGINSPAYQLIHFVNPIRKLQGERSSDEEYKLRVSAQVSCPGLVPA